MSYHLHAPLKIFAPAMDVPSSRPSPIMPNPFIIRPSIYPYVWIYGWADDEWVGHDGGWTAGWDIHGWRENFQRHVQ